MRKTRRDRKNYNEGHADGFAEGYKQGLHDGNPFNLIIEAFSGMVKTITADPELMAEALRRAGKTPEELDAEIEAEESEEDTE